MSKKISQEQQLPFTGERFTPECVREIWYEHWHRYAFAAPLVKGLRVVDVACGEGYGSHLLARQAAHVTGIDIDEQAIAHASNRYQDADNLNYITGDCADLPLADASVDRVVSFETLEHIEAQSEMISECRRVLKPGGVLIMSTPDHTVYSEVIGSDNAFHVRELERQEFIALLQQAFPAVRLFGQKLMFLSAIWNQDHPDGKWGVGCSDAGMITDHAGMPWPPVYHVALCAARTEDLPDTASLHLFADAEQSVYAHYNQEVGKHIQAGLLLQQRDQRIADLEAELRRRQPQAASWWRRLFARRNARSKQGKQNP